MKNESFYKEENEFVKTQKIFNFKKQESFEGDFEENFEDSFTQSFDKSAKTHSLEQQSFAPTFDSQYSKILASSGQDSIIPY